MLQAAPIPGPVSRLPVELIVTVFEHLDGKSLARVGAVSRSWRQLSKDDRIWRHAYAELAHCEESALPLMAPASAGWRQRCITLGNVLHNEAKDRRLERDIVHAGVIARTSPNWMWHASLAGEFASRGIGGAFGIVGVPILLTCSALSAATGTAVGIEGSAFGVVIGLGTAPIFGEAGLCIGAVTTLASLAGSGALWRMAGVCASNSYRTAIRSSRTAVVQNLLALEEGLLTALSLGGAGYHALIRAPKARARATALAYQRDDVTNTLARLRKEVQRFGAVGE